jgi:predicted O-methyltransferase YrrM
LILPIYLQILDTEILCKANPQLQLSSIDCWEMWPAAYLKAQERLSQYNVAIIKSKSVDIHTLNRFPDGSLDFVYIDADHAYLPTSRDIYYWTEKVRIGGIVAGHDYHLLSPQYDCDVVQAVDEYTAVHKISPWYVTREPEASWFWVKLQNQLT